MTLPPFPSKAYIPAEIAAPVAEPGRVIFSVFFSNMHCYIFSITLSIYSF